MTVSGRMYRPAPSLSLSNTEAADCEGYYGIVGHVICSSVEIAGMWSPYGFIFGLMESRDHLECRRQNRWPM